MRKMRKGVSLCYFPKLISLNLSLKYNFGSRTRVKKEYMNEPRSHSNESVSKDRMTKKNL